MRIQNRLLEDSFDYRGNLQCRDLSECVLSLDGIYAYASDIGERLHFDDGKLYEQEIKESVTLAAWLWYEPRDGSDKEYKDMLEQVLTKPIGKEQIEFDASIDICLYPHEGCCSTAKQYVNRRRDILARIQNKNEFRGFMQSCFMNSVFSSQIATGLNTISDFSRHTEEIVANLAVLNDEAVSIYKENKTYLAVAYDILSSKLLECAPDTPENARHLQYEFIDEGNSEIVECSPHLKLVRRDSNLRIYFYWCHDNVGGGKKVLIGRIGTHPY
jgi:hypothetical protein